MVKYPNGERGQALVLAAMALVALLILAGLAIDGGMVFLDRRRMQNASDAAALAGAQALAAAMCGDDDAATTDAAIYEAVTSYARRNGVKSDDNVLAFYVQFTVEGAVVEFNPPVQVGNSLEGGDGVPTGATGVAVTSDIEHGTHLISLAGIDTAGAAAYAMAVTGPPLTGGGLRPIGVPWQAVESMIPGDPGSCFTIHYASNCKPDDPSDPCIVEYTGGESSHRGLMNFDYIWNQREDSSDWPRAEDHTGDDKHLKTWMEEGWNGTLYADCEWSAGCRTGDYVHAKPGAPPNVIKEVPLNETFFVPIFDELPDCPEKGRPVDIGEPYPDDRAEGGDACKGGQGGNYYHIVGFAGIKATHKDQGGKTITACLEVMITGEGTPSPNEGYGNDMCETGAMVVALWE